VRRFREQRLVLSTFLAVAVVCLVGIVPVVASHEDDQPLPGPTRYVRTLGPFPIEGHEFAVELHVVCYKQSKHAGKCNEDDEETVSSASIVDENGKTRFKKSFPVGLVRQTENHLVSATLLEGREHQALELAYQDFSAPSKTRKSIQIFALQNSVLKPLDPEPLEFEGGLAELPAGQSENSRRLLEGDTLDVYVLTTYFYIVTPVRVNWKDFRLEEQDSGEFDVADQPPYEIRPNVSSERPIHLYPSPDDKTTPVGINLTPQSHIQLLKARFSAAPPNEHDSANDTWLKVRIDGQEGWILGVDDYTALGLRFLGENGAA
jgi:hypothetical protein